MHKKAKIHQFIKVFCLIFSVYLIVLSWQPCQEIVNNAQLHIQFSNNQVEDYHAEDNSSEDNCSPFCICSCCQMSVAYHNFLPQITTEISPQIKEQLISFYENPYLSNNLNSVWRPPKSLA